MWSVTLSDYGSFIWTGCIFFQDLSCILVQISHLSASSYFCPHSKCKCMFCIEISIFLSVWGKLIPWRAQSFIIWDSVSALAVWTMMIFYYLSQLQYSWFSVYFRVRLVLQGSYLIHANFSFVEHLRDFHDVFTIASGSNGNNNVEHVTLHSSLRTPDERTNAVGSVIRSLGDLIPGIRNEVLSTIQYPGHLILLWTRLILNSDAFIDLLNVGSCIFQLNCHSCLLNILVVLLGLIGDFTFSLYNLVLIIFCNLTALSNNIILWHACLLLSGTCCCSLLWYKGSLSCFLIFKRKSIICQ